MAFSQPQVILDPSATFNPFLVPSVSFSQPCANDVFDQHVSQTQSTTSDDTPKSSQESFDPTALFSARLTRFLVQSGSTQSIMKGVMAILTDFLVPYRIHSDNEVCCVLQKAAHLQSCCRFPSLLWIGVNARCTASFTFNATEKTSIWCI